MDNEKIEKLLEKYIFDASHIGSGDDGWYYEKALEGVNKIRKNWIEFGMIVAEECSKEMDVLIDEARELCKRDYTTGNTLSGIMDGIKDNFQIHTQNSSKFEILKEQFKKELMGEK